MLTDVGEQSLIAEAIDKDNQCYKSTILISDHADSRVCKSLAALVIWVYGGIFCYVMVSVVKAKLGYDDSLDTFGVHGAGGRWEQFLLGFLPLVP